MGVAVNYKKEIIKLTSDLPADKLKELLDFASFLKAKKEGFAYAEVKDSAEYVRKLRVQEGKRVKSGKKFIAELIEWQKSDS
jgi:hypothetical protein